VRASWALRGVDGTKVGVHDGVAHGQVAQAAALNKGEMWTEGGRDG